MASKRKVRDEEPGLFSLRCEQCGEYLISTTSGYLCCPMGHGRLQIDAPPDDGDGCGLWSVDDLPGESRQAGSFGDDPPEWDVVGGL